MKGVRASRLHGGQPLLVRDPTRGDREVFHVALDPKKPSPFIGARHAGGAAAGEGIEDEPAGRIKAPNIAKNPLTPYCFTSQPTR